MTGKSKRIWELDFWRGLAIILVVFDHAFFDFGRLFYQWRNCGVGFLEWLNALGLDYLGSDVRAFWRPAFLFLFFCVSGLCTALSKNNFLRGIKLWTVALCVSVITYIGETLAGEGVFVLFGVLHCLASVILIYAAVDFLIRGAFALVEKIWKKPVGNKWKTILSCVILFGLSAAFFAINRVYNPRLNEVTGSHVYTELDGKIFGIFFYSPEWWTADYFPIFPFVSFFFFGAALSKILYVEKKSLFPSLDGIWHNVFSVAGRHSLGVYLLGQVLAIGVGILLSLVFLGTPLLFP